jgi:hypothetical protein
MNTLFTRKWSLIILIIMAFAVSGCDIQEAVDALDAASTEELIADLGTPEYDMSPADVGEDPMYYNMFDSLSEENFTEVSSLGVSMCVYNMDQRIFILNTKFHDLPNYDLWAIMDDMFYDTGFDFGYCKSYQYNGWIVDCYRDTVVVTRESWEGDYMVWFIDHLVDGILNQ